MKSLKNSISIIFVALLVFSQLGATALAEKQSAPNAPASPVNLQIPNLAFDEDSITLVWDKPENYRDIVDFNVYMNGKMIQLTLIISK
ncbi:hypothetical protein V7139_19180 [Neobacillus drentensis]|uniref:hypothetical protein n=1 Tax=Neobacillus drentensis TaxID=220684 RepID=UPI003002DBE0